MTRTKILAVDDDPLASEPLRQILTEKGYDVRTATNGDDALAVLAAESFDLVLLDVGMPGPSGFDVCRSIRGNPTTEDLPVVFLTGHSAGSDIAQGVQAGSDLYLVKPVLATKLLGHVESLLARPRKPAR
jgi:DNA-binding response OmpR family regulator